MMVNMNGLSNQTWRNFVKSFEERLERFLKSQGISFAGNFRWIPKTFNEELPKKHKKKPIVEF